LAERRALSPGPEAVAAASDGPRLSGGRSAAAGPTHGTAAPPPAMDAPSPRTGSWVASAAPSSKGKSDISPSSDGGYTSVRNLASLFWWRIAHLSRTEETDYSFFSIFTVVQQFQTI